MKKLLTVGSVVVFMGLALGGPALAGEYHASTGVVAPSKDANVLVMTQVDKPSVPDHQLLITKDTQILGSDGQPMALAELRASDYIREDCIERADGKFEARKIVQLTPFGESWFR